MLPDHSPHVEGIASRLPQAIAFLFSFTNKESLTVAKADLSRAAAKFRFDYEHTCWAHQHMIDVESLAHDVMDRPIANRPQLFEAFRHRQLPALAAIQIAKPKEHAAENDE